MRRSDILVTDMNVASTTEYTNRSSLGFSETLLTSPGDVIVTNDSSNSSSSNDDDDDDDDDDGDGGVTLVHMQTLMRVLGPVLVVSGDTAQRFAVDALFHHSTYNSASRCNIPRLVNDTFKQYHRYSMPIPVSKLSPISIMILLISLPLGASNRGLTGMTVYVHQPTHTSQMQ